MSLERAVENDGAEYSYSMEGKNELSILSLDGGGVRSLIQLYFLSHMEAAICRGQHDGAEEEGEQKGEECTEETPLTCNLFDMYAGSSAGGMIAMLLGVRRMSMSAIRKRFGERAVRRIFEKSVWDSVFGQVQFRPKYDGREKARVLQECLGADTRFSKSATGGKIVMVTAYDLQSDSHKSRFFVNYDYECNAECAPLAWKLADATSAAPTYFPAVHIEAECAHNLCTGKMGGRTLHVNVDNRNGNVSSDDSHETKSNETNNQPHETKTGAHPLCESCPGAHAKNQVNSWFVDGGVNRNNPALTAALLARRHLRNLKRDNVRVRVLSIGTGMKGTKLCGKSAKDYGGIQWFQNNLLGMLMDETHTDEELRLLMDDPDRDYLRVNGKLEDFGIKDDLDDVSAHNIRRIKQLSQQMWRAYAKDVFRFLRIPFHTTAIEPLSIEDLGSARST